MEVIPPASRQGGPIGLKNDVQQMSCALQIHNACEVQSAGGFESLPRLRAYNHEQKHASFAGMVDLLPRRSRSHTVLSRQRSKPEKYGPQILLWTLVCSA